MNRKSAVLALVLFIAFYGFAAEAQTIAEATKQLVVLSVQPKAAPVPALRYQLLPTLEETNPGNPIQAYLKCFMEENSWFNNPQVVYQREQWMVLPLKLLPVQQILREYGGNPPNNIDYAARLDAPDWQCLARMKKEGAMYLLPDVTAVRTLAYTIDVRFRAQVAAGHFDDAIASCKTMFAMSRHFAAEPCLVGDMCGVSVLEMALTALEEMVQQRGSPNLYWALSALPSPMIDIEGGVQGEQLIMSSTPFTALGSDEPMSDAELQKAIDRLDDSVGAFWSGSIGDQPKKGYVRQSLMMESLDRRKVLAATQRLVAAGFDEKKLSGFLPLQVILADEYLALRERQQNELKVMLLPYWQADPMLSAQLEKKPHDGDRGSALRPFYTSLVPCRAVVVKIDQRIAMLRCVEALRIYAAEHGGKLPARLDDLTVPVPLDPVSGSPLTYRLDGEIATIQGKPPALRPNYKANPTYRVVIDGK